MSSFLTLIKCSPARSFVISELVLNKNSFTVVQVEADFFGFMPWVVIRRVTLPLTVFFRLFKLSGFLPPPRIFRFQSIALIGNLLEDKSLKTLEAYELRFDYFRNNFFVEEIYHVLRLKLLLQKSVAKLPLFLNVSILSQVALPLSLSL